MAIIDLTAYFYADDSLVASPQSERLQRYFDVLTSLFDWVRMRTNMANTVGMVCQICHAPGEEVLEENYVRQVTGKGPTF